MERTCPATIILQVGKSFEAFLFFLSLFTRDSAFVRSSKPEGKRDLLCPHFVWPLRYSSLRTLHPLLKPRSCRRLHFKSHFSLRISLCFLISPLKLSNLPFFTLIPIKGHSIFMNFLPHSCFLSCLVLFSTQIPGHLVTFLTIPFHFKMKVWGLLDKYMEVIMLANLKAAAFSKGFQCSHHLFKTLLEEPCFKVMWRYCINRNALLLMVSSPKNQTNSHCYGRCFCGGFGSRDLYLHL